MLMKRLWLALGTIFVAVLLTAAGRASWAYSREQRFKSYIHEADESLTKSTPEVALQFAAKIPEDSREFAEAQEIKATALREIAQDTDRISDQAADIIKQFVELKKQEKEAGRDLAIADPNSQRTLKLKKDIEQLQDLEHKLLQSNPYTAAGEGSLTDAGREWVLEHSYEKAVGHSVDSRTATLITSIVEQRGLERAAANRREYAANFQAGKAGRGTGSGFSTGGEFDTVLVMTSSNFTEEETLRRVTQAVLSKVVASGLCKQGFTKVELRIPGISKSVIEIQLSCGSN